ncbi:hypothetical protein [Helicobacter sp. 23-1046]
MKYFVAVIVGVFLSQSVAFGAKAESEHPPLSESTKKAIAQYKRNPSEANKQNLLDSLNASYDAVIAQKKEKLATREKEREKNISAWLNGIKRGKNPPFMNLETDNNKGNEREIVAKAISAYNQNKSVHNEKALKEALSAYYEAFLQEQRVHIKETEDLREERIRASFERFSSERFALSPKGAQSKVAQNLSKDEILAEIIANFINVGAEFVPVNPESRVRERKFNALINDAQKAYLQNPSKENKANLRNAVAQAYQSALEARIQSVNQSAKKGVSGGAKLLEKMQDSAFLDEQFSELTQQRNLYGRIDRIISFGGNTADNFTPRARQDSMRLATALKNGDKNAMSREFNALYGKMIDAQKAQLDFAQKGLDRLVDECLESLIATPQAQSNPRKSPNKPPKR